MIAEVWLSVLVGFISGVTTGVVGMYYYFKYKGMKNEKKN